MLRGRNISLRRSGVKYAPGSVYLANRPISVKGSLTTLAANLEKMAAVPLAGIVNVPPA